MTTFLSNSQETKRRVFEESLEDSELLPKLPNNRSVRKRQRNEANNRK